MRSDADRGDNASNRDFAHRTGEEAETDRLQANPAGWGLTFFRRYGIMRAEKRPLRMQGPERMDHSARSRERISSSAWSVPFST